ncbi:MAG: hypothetical protein Q9221_004145 [Calogaya cf. arnoldii]
MTFYFINHHDRLRQGNFVAIQDHPTSCTLDRGYPPPRESDSDGGIKAIKNTISLYASPVFSIYAGPARKLLMAHATFLRQSPMLTRMIDGEWRDSKDREIDLTWCDELTVHQLLEFLYSGTYHTGFPPDENDEVELTDGMANCNVDDAQQTAPIQTSAELNSSRPADGVNHIEVSTGHKPVATASNDPLATLRAATLLQHSTLYKLAHYLELTSLKQETYGYIYGLLDSFRELPTEPLGYITQLIRHVYANTDALNNSKEPLRELVATFAAKWFPAFQGDEAEELLEEGGDFVVDLMKKLQQRAVDEKKERETTEKHLHAQIKKYQKRLRRRGGQVDEPGSDGPGAGW